MQYKALTIAGFDSSGGAGIQADLKVFGSYNCYGMSVLTALPVQNTTGVKSCYLLPINAIKEQLDAVFSDITPNAIKIGMLFNSEIIEVVSYYLQKYAKDIPIVVDPVMLAKSGDALLLKEAITDLKQKILPLATIVTPNLPEAENILQIDDFSKYSNEEIAKNLLEIGLQNVLVKDGHRGGKLSSDILLTKDGKKYTFSSERIETKNTHGTGCTLSASIAANLAKGESLVKACEISKNYLQNALIYGSKYKIGKGHGPLHHFYKLEENN